MNQLDNMGYFEILEDTMGFSETEFRNLLYSIFLREIIAPVVNPLTGELTGSEENLEIEIVPQYPRPGDSININLRSFGFDLYSSNITWWSGGKVILSGIGEHNLRNFILNNNGVPQNILVVIKKRAGGILEKTITIHPSDIDIIHESHTYIPPFYEGKPEYSHNSLSKFIAIPTVRDSRGRLMGVNEFKYRWYVNNKIVTTNRTVGNNYFYYEDDIPNRDLKISVNIEEVGGGFNTLKGITISPSDPEVVLYEENPIYGTIFSRAIGNTISTSEREISIKAVPYFFSNDRNITYRWGMGTNTLAGFIDNIITFRAESSNLIDTNLSISVRNTGKLGQSAYNYFKLLVNN